MAISTVFVPKDTWVDLTGVDIPGEFGFQNLGASKVWFAAGGAAAPTGFDNAFRLGSKQSIITASFANNFPGVASPTRLWALCESDAAEISVRVA